MNPQPGIDFSVRRAVASDAPAIVALARAARIHARHLDWHNFAVATAASGQVVGCCQVRPRPGGYHELKTLAVTRAWRHRGVARALGEYVLPSSPRPLFGICMGSMTGFYERFGARPAASPPRRLRCERAVVDLVLWLRRCRDRAVVMCLDSPRERDD